LVNGVRDVESIEDGFFAADGLQVFANLYEKSAGTRLKDDE
jgi:hypothetical protein